MTQPAPPDVTAAILAYLKGITAVNDAFPGGIATNLDPTVAEVPLPALRVTNVSAISATHRRLRGYLHQFEAYADTEEAAFDAIALVDAAIFDEEAITAAGAGFAVITGTEHVNGPRDNPDPSTGHPRQILEARIYARPE